jgi:hypothetical protein
MHEEKEALLFCKKEAKNFCAAVASLSGEHPAAHTSFFPAENILTS